MRGNSRIRLIILSTIGAAGLAAVILSLLPGTDAEIFDEETLEMPANRWLKVASDAESSLGWSLQAHSGIAFDRKRHTLLIFGSDTHGLNWDNAVHEFDPNSRTWQTHYLPAARETYRADAEGQAISGAAGKALPWAMHTYDELVYDPRLDALVVVAADDHNYPAYQNTPGVRFHPTWIYSLATREWRTLDNRAGGEPRKVPNFFAAAAVHDPDRDLIWAFGNKELWYIDDKRRAWRRALPKAHDASPGREIHFSLAYDRLRHNLVFFGNHHETRDVVIYTPGLLPEEPGTWSVRRPLGDPYPMDSQVPVAFDERAGVFLLLPEESTPNGPVAATMIYDPGRNEYIRFWGTETPALQPNLHYLLTYDSERQVFWLVTRSQESRPSIDVWALRLDYPSLRQDSP